MTLPELFRAITAATGVTIVKMKSKSRKREVVYARYLTYYFCQQEFIMIKYRMATLFKQNHATVLHGLTTIENFVEQSDPLIINLITKIQNHVKNNETAKRLPIQAQIHRLSVGSLGSKGANGRHRPMFRPAQTYFPHHQQTRMEAG
jgi:hypothetical protein